MWPAGCGLLTPTLERRAFAGMEVAVPCQASGHILPPSQLGHTARVLAFGMLMTGSAARINTDS